MSRELQLIVYKYMVYVCATGWYVYIVVNKGFMYDTHTHTHTHCTHTAYLAITTSSHSNGLSLTSTSPQWYPMSVQWRTTSSGSPLTNVLVVAVF